VSFNDKFSDAIGYKLSKSAPHTRTFTNVRVWGAICAQISSDHRRG